MSGCFRSFRIPKATVVAIEPGVISRSRIGQAQHSGASRELPAVHQASGVAESAIFGRTIHEITFTGSINIPFR